MAVTKEQAHYAWRAAERIKRLSDRLVGVGPIGLGLDGILAWVPVAGTVYSVGAGALLVFEGFRGGASIVTLARMTAYLAFDSATSTVPVAGWAVDTLFPGHLMAAKALQKDIEARHGPSALPESWDRKRRARAARRGVKI
ncbi:MAG: DUF4112 domain-containing protein [Phenylobacterium sp.]|uniref:DUF4112 domain-containing protein n=1 Tax=Phenylobacterium sp. TaxID=1871053 RepID=UPI002727799F|nr:DUF4112 domain-containing protein [Phenylobacterium sp.]MDO8902263.1 DUF4112 domain-containing protein [Phenylobacterium sp.]MDP2212718.1 DUF4112 domain-containing protein [Phenylobacterium sp.]